MEKEFKTLQLFYAAALADSVYHYHNAGILNLVTEAKLNQQKLTAPSQLKQLNIENPVDLFKHFSEVFGCIRWELSEEKEEVLARGKQCLLCSIARKMNTERPCYIYCINPVKSLLEAMSPAYHLSVEKTLWEGEECIFRVQKK